MLDATGTWHLAPEAGAWCLVPGAWCLVPGTCSIDPLNLLPSLVSAFGHLPKLLEQLPVHGREIEAGLALHPLLQIRRNCRRSFRCVHRHQVVADVAGGTESANLAVLGPLAEVPQTGGGAVVLYSSVEHPAVRESAKAVATCWVFQVREIPVDAHGLVDLDALERVLSSTVMCVAVMTANNETGVVQPLPDLVAVVRGRAPEACVFTDAVQAAPYLDLAAATAGADLVSLSVQQGGRPGRRGRLGGERSCGAGTPPIRRGAGARAGGSALRTSPERSGSPRRCDWRRPSVPRPDRGCRTAGPVARRPAGIRGRGAPHGPRRGRGAAGPPPPLRPGCRAGGAAGALGAGRVRLGWIAACSGAVRRATCSPPWEWRPNWRAGRSASALGTPPWMPTSIAPCPHRRAGRGGVAAPGQLKELRRPDRGVPGGTLVPMRVLVAMSGGVDSSVVASLLVDAGSRPGRRRHAQAVGGPSDSGCCSVADVDDARRVAEQIGDRPTTSSTSPTSSTLGRGALRGRSPRRGGRPIPVSSATAPQVRDRLLDRARPPRLRPPGDGAPCPGGRRDDGAARLRRGADPAKDQSYVLSMLGQYELVRVLPVGEMTKDGGPGPRPHRPGPADRGQADSQDVCFIRRRRAAGDSWPTG